MFYLLTQLTGACRLCGVFNVFNYITFRSAGAAVTAMFIVFLIGPATIARLRAMRVNQGVREGTPDSHQSKGNTPTMGGVIILIAGLLPTVLWARLSNRYIWIAIAVTAWMGAIGFIDDYLKLRQQREGKKNQGLIERYKLVGQVAIGIALGVWLWLDPLSNLPGASSTLPFYKYVLVVPMFAWMYVPWVAFVLTGVSNAVNLTDGLDGLAAGLSAIAFATFGLFAYVIGRSDTSHYLQIYYLPGSGELAVFCAAIIGGLIGFLWYNTYPAQVFMGDTGSLALGGALGAVAILLKSEFLLVLIGGVFVAETVSVILQRSVFKQRKRTRGVEYARAHRVFLRAPVHHHFEMKGWSESQVVVRFWILGILCALIALSTLKLAMIPAAWRAGETAVIGLGKSGSAAAELLARDGLTVYASDAGTGAELDATAARLRAAGVTVDVGRHDLDRIARAALVVASPGVPPEAPPLARARAAGVAIVSEVEVGLHHLPGVPYIAITGTNGKTTTTALTAHLLRALGVASAVDAGNIGTPVCALALAAEPPSVMVLEMSSFQLHDTPGINPAVGVLTNLTPDHLDRYPSVEEYYDDKLLLFRNSDARSRTVLNADDKESMFRARPAGAVSCFSVHSVEDAWYDRAAGELFVHGEQPLMARRDLPLIGDHNVANALAAVLAVMDLDEQYREPDARRLIANGLRAFRALPHRLETVGEFGGVLWINDSKATNVSSALVAIEGMTRPAVVLLGGRHKGEPYAALVEPLRRQAKAVIAYGEAGAQIAYELDSVVPVERMGADFEAVIARARALAAPGDAVLLSPACSSYDMFTNYMERGAAFRRLAAGT